MTTLANWRLPLPGPDRRGWQVWAQVGFSVGLGILAKGPVALVLFGGTFLFASFLVPAFRGVWRSAWPLGLAVAGIVLATWYVPCYLANGQAFIEKFLVEQNVGRFAGGDTAHNVPTFLHPVYYPAILLLSLLPWIVFSGASLFRTGRTSPASQTEDVGIGVTRYLWIWALVPLAFFSLSGTKLPHYILPAVPPLAVLVSSTLLRVRGRWPWEHVGLAWSACVFVVAQYTFTSIWNRRMSEVQTAAKYVREHKGRLVVYKIGATDEPASPLQLRETSHPSILFYLHDTAVVTDDPREMRAASPTSFVLTTAQNLVNDPEVKGYGAVPVPGLDKFVLLQPRPKQGD
jgi:4-amino-4-deoxy-L-arabinose transferase-like glycosyltransferase